MPDDSDDIPEEMEDDIESMMERLDPSIDDLLLLQIETLIQEAEQEWVAEYENSKESDLVDIYDGPYESGPAMLWRLTDQVGIDSDSVTWWLAALALNDDGSPIYLIQERLDQLSLAKVEISRLPKLADGFSATENHHMKKFAQESDQKQSVKTPIPPAPSEISPAQISDDEWEYIVSPEAANLGDRTLAIRRAPVLDHGSLNTYVIEVRNDSEMGDRPSTLGAFWGHHGGQFRRRIEEAINRLT